MGLGRPLPLDRAPPPRVHRHEIKPPPIETDFVFPRSPGSGEPLPPDRVSQAWQRLCKELGV
jgi:hypothetical protein